MNTSLQREVLITLLTDKEKLKAVRHDLKPQYIGAPHLRWALKKLYKYYDKYSDVPPFSYFKTRLEKDKRLSKEDKERYYKLIRNLYKRKVRASVKEYAVDEINLLIQKQKATEILEEAIQHLEDDKIEETIKAAAAMTKVKLFQSEYEISNWINDWKTRQELRKERRDNPSSSGVIKFPWSTLNRAIGGIQPGETCCFASTTGVGKSIALILCGKQAFLDNHKVAHFVTENSLWQTAQRYDSALLGVEYDKLKYFKFKRKELRELNDLIRQTRKYIGENLRIIKIQPRRASIVTIERALGELEDSGFVPNYLIVDSADHMIAERQIKEYRLDQAEVYWDIKTIADVRKIPSITSTQVAKQYKGKKSGAEALAEAYDKARILDLVFTMNQLIDGSPELLFKVAKARDAKGGQELRMIADYGIMSLREIK